MNWRVSQPEERGWSVAWWHSTISSRARMKTLVTDLCTNSTHLSFTWEFQLNAPSYFYSTTIWLRKMYVAALTSATFKATLCGAMTLSSLYVHPLLCRWLRRRVGVGRSHLSLSPCQHAGLLFYVETVEMDILCNLEPPEAVLSWKSSIMLL